MGKNEESFCRNWAFCIDCFVLLHSFGMPVPPHPLWVIFVCEGRAPSSLICRSTGRRRFLEAETHFGRWEGNSDWDLKSHPLLGWYARFDPQNFMHSETKFLHGRRPVLLFGDSYAQCSKSVKCFEDFLNRDSEFKDSFHLLNYGVGGYGLGQISLLIENIVGKYKNPFIVIGLMVFDLDRSAMQFRTGPKPRYFVEDTKLVLEEAELTNDIPKYLLKNPVKFNSFLYRRICVALDKEINFARIPFLDSCIKDNVPKKKNLNRLLVKKIVADLESRKLDYVFLVFNPNWVGVSTLDGETTWREPYLRELFEQLNLPYIWSADAISSYRKRVEIPTSRFFGPEDSGHPSSLYNELIAKEIKKFVLAR